MRYITGGRSTPREEIRDEIIPFHPDYYGRSRTRWRPMPRPGRVMEKSGLTLVRLSPYAGSGAVDGSAQGEVEYELTRAQWETRAGSDTCPAH